MITNFYKLYNKFSTHLILQRSFRHFSALTLTHRCNLSLTILSKTKSSKGLIIRTMWKAAGRVPPINPTRFLRETNSRSLSFHAGRIKPIAKLNPSYKNDSIETQGEYTKHNAVVAAICNSKECLNTVCNDENCKSSSLELMGNLTSNAPKKVLLSTTNYDNKQKPQEFEPELATIPINKNDFTPDKKVTAYVQKPNIHAQLIKEIPSTSILHLNNTKPDGNDS
jgi:hypothetical protein